VKCLARHLFTLCSAVSLLLCVAVCVIWVRSCLTPPAEHIVSFGAVRGTVFPAVPLYAKPERSVWLATARGRVLLVEQRATTGVTPPVDASHCGAFVSRNFVLVYDPPDVLDHTGLLGFGHASVALGATGSASVLSVPFWAVAALTLVAPAIMLQRRLKDRRWRRAGLCPTCGYDLRASRGRCPECGTPAT
jgi:hypothetical protein